MIDIQKILGNSGARASVWCAACSDSSDLARVAEIAIASGAPAISVAPDNIATLWPWLENHNIKIFARFYVDNVSADAISDLAEKIKTGFKHGADGAQIFVRGTELSSLLEQLRMIRDDLFFNKDVVIGLDICDIGPFDWRAIFAALGTMRVNGIMLALVHDDGDASDFVGRVFACLGAWPDGMNAELQFAAGLTPNRIEQAIRLTQTMQPDMLSRCMFFVGDMRM